MAVRIIEQQEPPKEFHLEKYKALEDESVDDLLRHFGKRRWAWQGNDNEQMARARMGRPLDKPPIAWREGVEDQFKLKDKGKIQRLLISDLLVSDLDSMSHELRNDPLAEKAQRHHRVDELSIDRENRSGLCGYLRVGLWMSEELVLSEFTRWFRAARERKGLPAKSLRLDYTAALIKNQILPYIDLLLFYRAIDKPTPPNHVLGSWLFPNEATDTAEKIRKTVHPRAMEILEGGGLALLCGKGVGESLPPR
jgi:hypothetical protein